jgi:hypothetical protein
MNTVIDYLLSVIRCPLSVIRYSLCHRAANRADALCHSDAEGIQFFLRSPLFLVPFSLLRIPFSLFRISFFLFRVPFLRIPLFFVPFFFSACSAPPDSLGQLDLVKWRSDRGGCKEIRKTLETDFKSVENQLLSLHIDKAGQLLGRPDIHQLGSRDQKFYVYFLEKGPHCNDITQKSTARKVILRFNSVGLLSEISYRVGDL